MNEHIHAIMDSPVAIVTADAVQQQHSWAK